MTRAPDPETVRGCEAAMIIAAIAFGYGVVTTLVALEYGIAGAIAALVGPPLVLVLDVALRRR
ncbi:MAG: hypothetical protein L0227_09395 [Chloroflexi bacterium]|nr:hypothetical protein [Chloroflexota bacterium]